MFTWTPDDLRRREPRHRATPDAAPVWPVLAGLVLVVAGYLALLAHYAPAALR